MHACPDCGENLPAVDSEGRQHTCACSRRFASYIVDFSSTWPRYRWNPLPKGDNYWVHPSGIPILEGGE